MVKRLLLWLLGLLRHKDVCQTGADGKKVLYLRRYYLPWPLRNRWFGVFIHHIVRSDDDLHGRSDPHDHPWAFMTMVLSGFYFDERWKVRNGEVGFKGYQRMRRFFPYFRSKDHIHRVMLPHDVLWRSGASLTEGTVHWIKTGKDVRSAWTLFVRGRRTRTWGFWTSDGFVPWYEYLGVPKPADEAEELHYD